MGWGTHNGIKLWSLELGCLLVSLISSSEFLGFCSTVPWVESGKSILINSFVHSSTIIMYAGPLLGAETVGKRHTQTLVVKEPTF